MTTRLPLYLKLSTIVVGLFVFFYILALGQEILVPLTFSWILAILLNPVVNFLTRKRIPRVIAISIAVVLLVIVIGAVLFFIGSQISMFSDSLPQLKARINEFMEKGFLWVSDTFNISESKINAWIAEQKDAGIHNAGGMIGNTVTSVSGSLLAVLLVPVYIFLFLYYKPLFLEFVARLFLSHQHTVVADVLVQTRTLIQSYLVGLLIETAIVAVANSAALFLIGIRYAILLGVIGAILNLIPYIGGIVAIALPMIIGFIDGNLTGVVLVLVSYIVIQIIDNNFLVPLVVASKVKVNAMVSIVVVLIGGAIWGMAGMFLSIPLTAIAKVIFDRVESLKPYGLIIGDTMPELDKSVFDFSLKKKHV
jgi:predicted PurR-regulated permease PerM